MAWAAKTYSDPRFYAQIPEWPMGRQKKATAIFEVERDSRHGERVKRTITGDPVFSTYAHKVRIVTGDDGLTYIAKLYGVIEPSMVSIMRGDMKFSHETVHPRDPRFAEVLTLFQVEPAK